MSPVNLAPYAYVVGVDPSLTSTGLAIWEVEDRLGQRIYSRAVKVPAVSRATFADDTRRISRMVRQVTAEIETVTQGRRTMMVGEKPLPAMRASAKQQERACVLFGIASHVLGHRGDIARINVEAVKKYWTGRGNAEKADMVDQARLHFPAKMIENDDEADALALAHMGVTAITGTVQLSKPRVEVTLLQGVEWPVGFTPTEWKIT